MRKTFPTEAVRIVTMIILLMSTVTKGLAQSPYALFGDNSKMLEATEESVPNSYGVLAKTANGAIFYADFDLKDGIATLSDSDGNVILRDCISKNAKAMFTTIDPHAENYYHLSPYSYCGGNPIYAVDPDGRDYWSTNDIDQIIHFLNNVGTGNNYFDFSEWKHATDAEFCSNLVYNDETHKYYTSYAEEVDGELNVIGKTFQADITPVSYSGFGYLGAFVYNPVSGFWGNANYFFNGITYNDGISIWNVNRNGRVVGVAPMMCIVDTGGKSKASCIKSLIPKGFKIAKEFLSHNEKVYEYNGKYCSFDNTSHNGGVWKVFVKKGGRLHRIGTADKDLKIFKK